MLPCGPCSLRFSGCGAFSSVAIFGSAPGPLLLRFSGGTGGNLLMFRKLHSSINAASTTPFRFASSGTAELKELTSRRSPCRLNVLLSRSHGKTTQDKKAFGRGGFCLRQGGTGAALDGLDIASRRKLP